MPKGRSRVWRCSARDQEAENIGSRPSKRRRLETELQEPNYLELVPEDDWASQNVFPSSDDEAAGSDVESNAISPCQVIGSTALSESESSKSPIPSSPCDTSHGNTSRSLTLNEIDKLLGTEEECVGITADGVEDKVQDELVCFGMIKDIPVKLLEESKAKPDTVVKVSLLGPRMLLNEETSSPFAIFHEESAKLLRNLEAEVHASLQLFCELKNAPPAAKTKKGKSKERPAELSVLVHAVVCGPFRWFDETGVFLQRRGVYLQDPFFGDKTTKYRNPHRLCQVEDAMEDNSKPLPHSRLVDVELLETRVDPLSGLENGVSLQEAIEPLALNTRMYSHQKQALTFMLRRERGWALDAPYDDIWKAEQLPNGRPGYTNKITGDQQLFKPPEFKGGILADAMGLGKSLSMLSLIASNPSTRTNENLESFCKGTLLVVPFSLLSSWEAQCKIHLKKNTVTWYRYHGNHRECARLSKYDIVLTTFHTISAEWKKSRPGVKTIFSMQWHRIILDEAHIIRDSSTMISKAVRYISATHRWAVTGTPVQNRLADIGSIFQFLQVFPFSDPRIFTEQILKPWREGCPKAISKLIEIIRCIALRRAKTSIKLLPRVDNVHYISFDEAEKHAYETIKTSTTQLLNEAISNNEREATFYLNALQRINSLRLLCNLGMAYFERTKAVLQGSYWDLSTAQSAFESMESVGSASCIRCSVDLGVDLLNKSQLLSGEVYWPRLTKCLQLYCADCFRLAEKQRSKSGSICGCRLRCEAFEVCSSTPNNDMSFSDSKQLAKSPQISSKIRSLVEELKNIKDGEKSVVFSFWTSTLDLIALALKDSVRLTQLDGRLSTNDRSAALTEFNEDPNVTVILLSIGCGAVGLDLTVASRVYLMEPQWNPMIEEQALDRIHRIGQKKPVTTIRYIVKDSFEENIRNMQARKKHLADLSMSQSRLSGADLSQSGLEYLRSLVS